MGNCFSTRTWPLKAARKLAVRPEKRWRPWWAESRLSEACDFGVAFFLGDNLAFILYMQRLYKGVVVTIVDIHQDQILGFFLCVGGCSCTSPVLVLFEDSAKGSVSVMDILLSSAAAWNFYDLTLGNVIISGKNTCDIEQKSSDILRCDERKRLARAKLMQHLGL